MGTSPLRQTVRAFAPALLCLLAAFLILALLPRFTHTALLDVGAEGPLQAPDETHTARWFDLYEPERDGTTTFRWTQANSRIFVPHAHRLGAALRLSLRFCGCRTSGQQPIVLLGLDDRAPIPLPTGAPYRQYTLLVPPASAAPFGGLLLTLQSETLTTPTDARAVGVRLDAVRLWATPMPLLAGNLLLVGVLALIGAAPAIRRRAGESLDSLLLWVALPLGLLAVVALFTPQMAEAWIPVLALIWGVIGVALVRPSGALATLVLLVLMIGITLAPMLLGAWLVDDAYISFRYARNFVEGYGLVFNPGEQVEGYTNFLWTLLMAGVLQAGGNPEDFGLLVPLLAAQAAVVLCYDLGRTLVPPERCRSPMLLIAPSILAGSAPVLLYGARGSGMEMVPFALLLLLGLRLLLARRNMAAGALLGFAAMMRPEGAMVAALAGAGLLAASWRNATHAPLHRILPRLNGWGGLALGFLAVFGPYYAWRFSYYGLPLPNTFYVKVGASDDQVLRGLRYLAEYWLAEGLAWLIALLLLVLPGMRRRWVSEQQHTSLLLLILLVYTAYIAAVGGDWMPGSRFVVPILPILALLVQSVLMALGTFGRLGLLVAAALLAFGLFSQAQAAVASSSFDSRNAVWYENYVVGRRREVGRWLQTHLPPETLTAVEAAGALPYYSRQPTLDILGLNDRHIASLEVVTIGQGKPGHEKIDIPYILDRRPDVIPYFAVPYFDNQPRFDAEYERQEHQGPEGNRVILYMRRTP